MCTFFLKSTPKNQDVLLTKFYSSLHKIGKNCTFVLFFINLEKRYSDENP